MGGLGPNEGFSFSDIPEAPKRLLFEGFFLFQDPLRCAFWLVFLDIAEAPKRLLFEGF